MHPKNRKKNKPAFKKLLEQYEGELFAWTVLKPGLKYISRVASFFSPKKFLSESSGPDHDFECKIIKSPL